MYLNFFGFKEAPFSLTPDTDFFYGYHSHIEALNVALVALRLGEGFVKIIGEVGTGKTLLCRKLLNSLDDSFDIAYLPNPRLTPRALLFSIADELSITYPPGINQHQLLKKISYRLIESQRAGRSVILCVDEAQTMPDESLETIRLLTNLETEKKKLLQIILFAQPELDDRLDQASLRQLKQRITFSYRLNKIDWKGTNAYITYRLAMSGYRGKFPFQHQTIETIHRASHGTPRLINILCHKALMAGFGRGNRVIGKKEIMMAINDTESIKTKRPKIYEGRVLAVAASLFFLLIAGKIISENQVGWQPLKDSVHAQINQLALKR